MSHPSLPSYSVNRPQIEKVRYSHDAMIDIILSNPSIHQSALAKYFGYTQAWVSTIMSSDAFQARLAQRREEVLDPALTLSIEERFRALSTRSLEVLMEKLAEPASQVSETLALRAAELGAKALGIGGNAPPRTVIINTEDRLAGLASRLTGLLVQSKKDAGYEIEQDLREIPASGVSASSEGNEVC